MTSIGIVGSGAIGLLLAAIISPSHKVTLYTRRLDQKERIEREGILIKGESCQRDNLYIKDVTEDWEEDLILLAVKQPALPALLKAHPRAQHEDQALLFLQNGMGHLALLDDIDYRNVFIGVVEHGAVKENDNTIEWRGKGSIKVGIYKGDSGRLAVLVDLPMLNLYLQKEWLPLLEDKLLVNAVINPLTALYRVQNGVLFSNPFFYELAYETFKDVASVLHIPENEKEKKWDYIKKVGEKTALNQSSMLQDLEAGRQTEIEAILGYLLKKNGTLKEDRGLYLSFLYHSIKGMEALQT